MNVMWIVAVIGSMEDHQIVPALLHAVSVIYLNEESMCKGCAAAKKAGKMDNCQIKREGNLVKHGESHYIKGWDQRGYRLKQTDPGLKDGQYLGL